MSAIDDLIREVSWEAEVEGEVSFGFKDDLLMRVADLYDTLEPDDADRYWCRLLCMVLVGVVTPEQLLAIYGDKEES